MKLYKLTNKDGMTRDETQWNEGITHTAKENGVELCTNQVIHAYRDPYLAVFHNPIGGNFDSETMRLWEAEGDTVADDGMKVGCKSLTTTKESPVPVITMEQRVEIAIRCALVYKNKSFIKWANSWLSGKDRSAAAAAKSAAAAAESAASAAYAAAKSAAQYAAHAAASAAKSAASAAESAAAQYAAAQYAASAAAQSAKSAHAAASAAQYAAWYAANITEIIHSVVKKEV